jgi:ATP-dependent DNA ligase
VTPSRKKPSGQAGTRLPVDLAGPVDVELTHSVDVIPTAFKPGTLAIEPKWDGFRAVVIRSGGTARIWSRQRNDLTDGFRDIAAAAVSQLPDGVVLDGELVVSTNGRLDFDALQKRLVTTSPARARQLIAAIPASYVAFDLLAYGGVDLRTQRWATRRSRLEQLASGWSPPLQLTPVTYDLDEAREWFDVLPAAMGVEGLVLKPTTARYAGGRRSSWAKIKHRDTRDVIIGGVLGPITRPDVVIAGLYRGGDLVVVGRTVPLDPRQAAELGKLLQPAKPGHPWPDEISSQRWGGKDAKKPLTKVEPLVVAEVTADAALQAGQWRHPLRFVRTRADLQPADVDSLDPA